MKSRGDLSDNSAVAPVISTILMVAIVVILATVVATFALAFTDNAETAPTGAFSGEQIEKQLLNYGIPNRKADFWAMKITYEKGKTIDEENVRVLVNGEQAYGSIQLNGGPGLNNCNSQCHRAIGLWVGSGSIEAGDTVTVVHKDDKEMFAGHTYNVRPDGETNPNKSRLYPNRDLNPQSRIELNEGDKVQVIWESETGEDTAVLFEQEIE